jgi:hypothetical protein
MDHQMNPLRGIMKALGESNVDDDVIAGEDSGQGAFLGRIGRCRKPGHRRHPGLRRKTGLTSPAT